MAPLDGGRGGEVGSEGSSLSGGSTGGTEPDERGLGSVTRNAVLATEVLRGGGGGSSGGRGLGESLANELSKLGLLDASTDDSDVALSEDGVGVVLDVGQAEVGVRGGVEGGAETLAEGNVVRELDGLDCGARGGCGGVGLDDGGNVF